MILLTNMNANPTRQTVILTTLGLLAAAGIASGVDVTGVCEAPNTKFGQNVSYKLTGDTTFGWLTGAVAGDMDLNGHAFVMETGGGNRTVFSGAISGTGTFEWRGGGVPQAGPSVLGGEKPNTFKGVFTLAHGLLELDKPAGVDAIAGDLSLGTMGTAIVKLNKSNQINDASHVTLSGPGINGIDLNGHEETIASLVVSSQAVIQMGGEPATLTVGDCSACKWDLTKTVTVNGFKSGKDQLVFGKNDKGLSKEQLSRVGFDNPDGQLYSAKITSNGQVVPATRVSAINPPFDVSPEAKASRAKIYELSGLASLTGKGSPLKDAQTIVFFGDSITWQNTYIDTIDKAIKAGEGTKGKAIKLVNRGINGGGVVALRDGADGSGYPGNTAQKPFAEVIATEKANMAVVFIGINDVWWRKTTPEDFEKGLRDLAAAAKSNKTALVMATMTVHGELPDGKNGDDPKIEAYSEITRKVAKDTGSTLVDLRKAYVAYLQNQNAQLRVDGTLYFKPAGVLTYDGVHPSAAGTELLAKLIGDGIFRSLSKK